MDSIALTYSLLDPIMTVMRPVTAFVTAFVGGILENLSARSFREGPDIGAYRTCPVDACCDGIDCDPDDHARHHTLFEKLRAGVRFGADDLMHDLAVWFLSGIVLAGVITVLVPESLIDNVLGSGIVAYLAVLVVSLPMYVCASMSTPIAAALVLKGLSPGAALVLLVAGPATNMATVMMVGGLLGRRTLGIYLSAIVICTLIMAFVTDMVYQVAGISAKATAGVAARQLVPHWLELGAALVLAILVARVLFQMARARLGKCASDQHSAIDQTPASQCGCDNDAIGGT
jgi:uncharacterized membrane protein YraQ (UPF0718 family)